MSIFDEKKEVARIISPSLGYQLRSINWDENFYFENPIDKYEINSISKALKMAKDLFLAIERTGIHNRETYRWDEHLYFKTTAENILAAAIYYYCKHYPKEYCNLAYIIATVCSPDINILLDMLRNDKETEIFIRGLNDCYTLSVNSEYTAIKNELTTYLGRLYTKEFFYLFINGKYEADTPQSTLTQNFDNILFQIEKLKDNDFIFQSQIEEIANIVNSIQGLDGIPIEQFVGQTQEDILDEME